MANPIRIRLRYGDLDTFVEKFAPNVTRGGVFLASRSIYSVGTVIAFELQIATGEIVLAGQGRVNWVKEYDPAEPNRPFGMGVQFISVEPAAKPILARMLRVKDASGVGRRVTTGPQTPLVIAGGGSHGPGSARHTNGNGDGKGNGTIPPPRPPVDTSVDLAAEYGLDDQTMRRLIERTWMTGARTNDDLSDLLKPEPEEPATLAQALAELPRLLDPQYSRRRRGSSGFRSLEAPGPGNDPLPRSESNGIPERIETEAPVTSRKLDVAGDDLDESASTDLIHAPETTDMTGDREDDDSSPASSFNGDHRHR